MPEPFRPFTAEHLATVLVGLAAILGILALGRRGGRTESTTRRALALVNFAAFPASLMVAATAGRLGEPESVYPFHLCDLAAFTAVLALLARRPLFCELTYFWGLAGTLQGLVTPALTAGFPAAPCAIFFLQHFAIVAAAVYLPVVTGWRPRHPLWRTVATVYGWSLAYLGFALVTNRLTGGNFAYASHPPENPSLLDHLGPWPWYLLAMQGVALLLFSLLCLPFLRLPPMTHDP